MAFVSWEWNAWLDELGAGDGKLFFEGLKKAVRTHHLIRAKTVAQMREEYSIESHDDVVQELAIKVLSDDRGIMTNRNNLLGNNEIGKWINRILTNFLTDRWRRRRLEKGIFVDVSWDSENERKKEGETAIEHFLARRVRDLSRSPEGECILGDLLERFIEHLTPRERVIFEEYEEFGQGSMTLKGLIEKLGVKKSILYKAVQKIKKELASTLGQEAEQDRGESLGRYQRSFRSVEVLKTLQRKAGKL